VNGAARIVATRVWQSVLLAFLIATVCFAVVNALPGDMSLRVAAARYGVDNFSREKVEQVRLAEGLDRPVLERYGLWMARAARGDFGNSLVSRQPVTGIIATNGLATLQIGLTAWLLSYLLAIPLGMAAGLRQGSGLDTALQAWCAASAALPTFIVGMALIWIFTFSLGWLPPAGSGSLKHLVLPVAALTLNMAAYSVPIIRATTIEIAGAPYMTYAAVKGLGGGALFLRHGLRNGAAPVLTFSALQMAMAIEGFIVLEALFSYPGLGRILLGAVTNRDLPLVMGIAIACNFFIAAVMLIADLAVYWLRPSTANERRAA